LIGRYGGEEFAVFLPGVALAEAWEVAERIRQSISRQSYQIGDHQLAVTVSLGLASLGDGLVSWDVALQWADESLYQAKAQGRNQTRIFNHELANQLPA
jgi:diguanylate cyclase (GGDEF)-like protein